MNARHTEVGARVVSERKLSYLNEHGPGLCIVPKGLHGTVIAITTTYRSRLVKFDNGMTAEVSIKHLLRPDLLDRIIVAIAED